jgi:hypothetical protein
VTRAVLCGALAALTLVVGILTAIVQSENHDRGQRLNALKEECSMIEAINGDRSEQILERDFGPIEPEAWPPAQGAKDAAHPAAGLPHGAQGVARTGRVGPGATSAAAAPAAKGTTLAAKSKTAAAKTAALSSKGVVR